MKKGRKPKPSSVKKRQGNPGHRGINHNEPAFVGTTTAPRHLDRIARTEWRRLAKRLTVHRMLTPADRTAFAAYCVAYSRHVQAETFLGSAKAKGSLVYRTEGGAIKPWPHVGISERALQTMHRFLVEFGMTPSSRSRLDVHIPKKETSDESFLFGDESSGDECPEPVAN